MQPEVKDVGLSGHLSIKVQVAALEALKGLASGKEGQRLVMLSVNAETEVIELVSSNANPSSVSDLAQAIAATEPRFTFFQLQPNQGEQLQGPVAFFFTCPSTPGVQANKSRFLYPLMKHAVLEIAHTECGLKADKKYEVEETSDITEDLLSNRSRR